MKTINVAIIGQGRSGRNIHGAYFKSASNTCYKVAAVVEFDPDRRQRALDEYPGCDVYADYTELFARSDIDLVVNASYSEMHYPISLDLVNHGKNVICEKPMARNHFEAANLVKAAKEKGVVLAIFQQTLLAPFYLFAKKVIAGGKLGKIEQVSLRYSGFARRWDWQTLQYKMAGSVFNTGPHPIGCACDLLDFDDNISVPYSRLATELTSGDAEDYAKILVTAPGKPLIDIEISSIDAYSDYTIRIQGSRGTYQSTLSNYKMKYIVDGENPEQPLIVESLKDAEGNPMYCSEKLITHTEEGDFKGTAFDSAVASFYEMYYNTLTTGAELLVKPENIIKVVDVTQWVHAANPLPVKF